MPDILRAGPCPNCASTRAGVYFCKRVSDRTYEIVRCQDCGLLYLANMPTSDTLADVYDSPAYFAGDATGYTSDYLKQRASIEREARRRLHQITQSLGREKTARTLLDIGCAAGFFLSVAQARGWRVHGVEPSSAMAKHASQLLGIEIPRAFVAEQYAANSYAAVTLWEVIEHLPAPLTMLRQLHAILVPGGVLALSTPNTGHWHAQRYPEWWSEFKPPAHVVYFDENTLRDLLSRAGFAEPLILRTRRLAVSPHALARLHRLRDVLGDSANRMTPFWFVTSFVYRATSRVAGAVHRARYPRDDQFVGLEAYARK